jgi:hypothetical protein
MFITFMSLHILLCDEVFLYFMNRDRSKFKFYLNLNRVCKSINRLNK